MKNEINFTNEKEKEFQNMFDETNNKTQKTKNDDTIKKLHMREAEYLMFLDEIDDL